MEIQWFGNNCFVITGKNATVLIDPTPAALAKLPQTVDIIITTSPNKPEKIAIDGIKHTHHFNWPGEYEAKGIAVTLDPYNPFENDHQLVHLIIDDIKVANLGYLSSLPTDERSGALGDVDILMLPVGDDDVLTAKLANEVIETIEPKVVVPSCFASTAVSSSYAPIADFAKESGITLSEPIKTYKLSSASALPTEQMEYVILSS